MTLSASRREAKRRETALRLMHGGYELTADHGFDGWTVDDLAEHAEVSRRTVFNYFDAKADIVLGPLPEVDDDVLAVFVDQRGPTGVLIDDVLVLADHLFVEQLKDQEAMAAGRRIVAGDPALIAIVHERFETITGQFASYVLQREGASYGEDRARLLVRLLVAMWDTVLDRMEAQPTRAFADLFAEAVTDARDVLHH